MSHLKRTVIEVLALLLLVGAFGLNMYCRGKRAGRAIQEGKDRREHVEGARKSGNLEEIDKEWEK